MKPSMDSKFGAYRSKRHRANRWVYPMLLVFLSGCALMDQSPSSPNTKHKNTEVADTGVGDIENADADTAGDADAGDSACTIASTCPAPTSRCAVAVCDEGRCAFALADAGSICRDSVGTCDVPEVCNGSSMDCPEDIVLEAGTVCRPTGGVCDLQEVCDGDSGACPEDTVYPNGTVCRPALRVCDGAVCDGSALDCPPENPAIAAYCALPQPLDYSANGRDLVFDLIDLNQTGTSIAFVEPGSEVTLQLTGSWSNTNTNCPACATQMYVGIRDTFTACLGSSVGSHAFDTLTTFTAPAIPGIYVVNPDSSTQQSCIETLPFDTQFSAESVGVLVVEGPVVPVKNATAGRILTLSTIDLNGTGTPVATVAPGDTVSLHIAGEWERPADASCPGCSTQMYVGMEGVFAECLGSTTGDLPFDRTTTFSAPPVPGIYIINSRGHWDMTCLETRPIGSAYEPDKSAGILIVR